MTLADGHYLVPCPDLVENLDIVASLRGSETLMTDMLERPEWVEKMARDMNRFYFEVFDRIYDIIKHLDGTQARHHLDRLIAIESLDAIEWTPQAGLPRGGSPQWFDLYRKILAGGKSVQAVEVKPHEVIPLLDAVGGRGVYIMVEFPDERTAEHLAEKVEPYRK